MRYTYPDGANIGKITQQNNVLTGEEVEYQYDSLGRMISAQTTGASQGAAWGYTYNYDAYGNLQTKNPTQPGQSAGWSAGVNPTTNRAFGATYDDNGNTLATTQTSAIYDVENRMISYTYNGTELYGYDPSNKRVQKTRTDGVTELHFYGAQGERLGIYELRIDVGHSATYASQKLNLYYAGRHFASFDVGTFSRRGVDRLGSETSNLYPWGEEKTTTGQNIEKFATYYRDGSGLDYADQRYYSSIMGRFLTPDPGDADLVHPQSFNRYAYGYSDPINSVDPNGSTGICPDDFVSGGAGGSSYPCYDPFGHIMVGVGLHTVGEYDDIYGDPHCGGQGYSFLPNGHPYCAPGEGGGSSKPKATASYLLVTADCYYTDALRHVDRRRTYNVLDQNFQGMGNGITVSESITGVTPSSHSITGGGVWTTGTGGEPAGGFQEFYGNGVNPSPTNAQQRFFSNIAGVGNVQLTVLEPNGMGNTNQYPQYGTQGVYYTGQGTKINGFWRNPFVPTNPGDTSVKPCDPPRPTM